MRAYLIFVALAVMFIVACGHPNPKPVSNNINKTTVTINGKKDSVINNIQKNYGNATVGEPCVKCLLKVIQSTSGFKIATNALPANNIIYNINWITSTKPKDVGDAKVVNGMIIDVNNKSNNSVKMLTTYVYNNASGKIYLSSEDKFREEKTVSDSTLKKIRRKCFWGVASSK